MDFHTIDTAPKDGTIIYAYRFYGGRLIAEGYAKWGINSPDAPMRKAAGGGLYGDIPADREYADTARWVTRDGRFSFPEPTHWRRER